MPTDDAHDTGEVAYVVAATAVSCKRTVLAAVNTDGYVVSVRLLDDSARGWDAVTLEQRVKAVAAVAHDRYLASLGATDGRYPTLDAVAAAELGLDFQEGVTMLGWEVISSVVGGVIGRDQRAGRRHRRGGHRSEACRRR